MLLLTACGGSGGEGGGGPSDVPIGGNNPGPPATVDVYGVLSYEYVPAKPNCNGLDFDPTAIENRPIRGATVQLLGADGTEYAHTVSAGDGSYRFSDLEPDLSASLRVRGELKKSDGGSRWDVEIRDNVDTSDSPPALDSRPLYVLDSQSFDTGSQGIEVNVTAETGWLAGEYSGERAAAPFAVLDAIYSAIKFIEAVDPDVYFPPLDVFWSVKNTADGESISTDAINRGELPGSFYATGLSRLFLTGDADGDTDEFDSHVVVHEWGHYFEDSLSRSDSPGGAHALGDKLDARLAFGEGWATALAAMALGDPLYCETGTPGTNAGFGINAEGGAYGGRGWYDEVSVVRFIYDLWDTTNENTDTGSIGFAPVYETMRGAQANTSAFTTLFSFAAELRSMLDTTGSALLDAQLEDEQVDVTSLNTWGDGEDNQGGATRDVLPVYIPYTAGDPAIEVCSNRQFDFRRDGNKLSQFRYLRVIVPSSANYHVTVSTKTPTPETEDPDDRDQSDPDMLILRDGQLVARLWSGEENIETTVPPRGQGPLALAAATYVADLREWRFKDDEAATNYPDRVCFDVEFSLAP